VLKYARHFLDAEHHGQFAFDRYRTGLVHHLGTFEGHREEEPQAGQRSVNRHRRGAGRGHVQLEAAKVFGISADRRTV
jgi:hypothetical protein